jgi:hypothetical protein
MAPSTLFRVVNSPAAEAEVAALLASCEGRLPGSYLEFLAISNGAESCINDEEGDCLALWSAKEVFELNEAYAIPRFLREFLAIGSNGGDDAVGFDRASNGDPDLWPVVQIGFGNLDRDCFVHLARGFRDWYDHGCRLRLKFSKK